MYCKLGGVDVKDARLMQSDVKVCPTIFRNHMMWGFSADLFSYKPSKPRTPPGSELSEQADAGHDRECADDVVTWWVLRVGSL